MRKFSLLIIFVILISLCLGCTANAISKEQNEEETTEWTAFDELAYDSCKKLQRMMKDPDSLRLNDVYILYESGEPSPIEPSYYVIIDGSGTNSYGGRVPATIVFIDSKESIDKGEINASYLGDLDEILGKKTEDCTPAELRVQVMYFLIRLGGGVGSSLQETMGDDYIPIDVEALSKKLELN